MSDPSETALPALAESLVSELRGLGWHIAVAESLTGGLVTAAIVDVAGASAVLRGGVVAYASPVKHALLGVDEGLLERRGAVDPEVARQMADGVRARVATPGSSVEVGIATTGVAGPDPADGAAVGTVFIAVVTPRSGRVVELRLSGSRARIRSDATTRALEIALGQVRRDGRE